MAAWAKPKAAEVKEWVHEHQGGVRSSSEAAGWLGDARGELELATSTAAAVRWTNDAKNGGFGQRGGRQPKSGDSLGILTERKEG